MRSFAEVLNKTKEGASLPEAILTLSSIENVEDISDIRQALKSRLYTMKESVDDALSNPWHPKLALDEKGKYAAYEKEPLSGAFIWRASEIACSVSTCNASMGRIVAAPTAGSCGILPGLLFAWKELRNADEEKLLDGLIVAAGIGDIIAARATLAGAAGGCQAECGSAVAMAAAALCYMEGGSADQCGQAAALSLKSILGLVCDPVCGLVEIPCIKRNSMLVSLGALATDMALAGLRSFIPLDEMIDAMGEVGKALPETLRETGRGGCARTHTGQTATRQICMTYSGSSLGNEKT